MTDKFKTSFEHFELELDANENLVFHGGERITGRLKIRLKRPMTIQLIRLQFKGRASFTGRDGCKSSEHEKVYFDKDFTLLDRPPGRPEPGHFPWVADFSYSLPFECPLPVGCPTSYEGPHAFIRYFVRAIVVEDAKPSPIEYLLKQCLTVVAPTETTAAPPKGPLTMTDTLSQGKCCCRSKVMVEGELQKSVYSPGENVVGALKITSKHQKKLLEMVEVRLTDRVGQADSAKDHFSSHRTLLRRQMEKVDFDSPNICFFRIPSVPPSISSPKIEDAFMQDSKFPESPSTMTLRIRKKPFLRIEYQIQISIGGRLLLEFPITIVGPKSGEKVTYEPFAAGPQLVDEADETMMQQPENGYLYTPKFPVVTEHITETKAPAPPVPEVEKIEQVVVQSEQSAPSELPGQLAQQDQLEQQDQLTEQVQFKQPEEQLILLKPAQEMELADLSLDMSEETAAILKSLSAVPKIVDELSNDIANNSEERPTAE